MLNRFSAAMIAARHTGRVARRRLSHRQENRQWGMQMDGAAFEHFQQVALSTMKPIVFAVSNLNTGIQERAQIAPISQATDLNI